MLSDKQILGDGLCWRVQLDPNSCTIDNLPCDLGDCVSSFPFLNPPLGCIAFATVSSKQLGAVPVLGLIFATRKAIENMKPNSRLKKSYDLAYSEGKLRKRPQTLNTPPVLLIRDLFFTLLDFNVDEFKKLISKRIKEVASTTTGDGPVRIPNKKLSSSLKCYEKNDGQRLFLWAGTDEEFKYLKEHL